MDTKIYTEILACGYITERQILTMKSRANKGFTSEVRSIFSNGNLMITPEQTAKGLDWLMDKWKTPRGAVRKNNPFTPRQQSILENFDRFELVKLIDRGTRFVTWHVPVYRVVSKHGRYFDYTVSIRDRKKPVEIYAEG